MQQTIRARLGVSVGKEAIEMATTTRTKSTKTSTTRKATSAGRRRSASSTAAAKAVTPTDDASGAAGEAAAVADKPKAMDTTAGTGEDSTTRAVPETPMNDMTPDDSADASSDDRLRRTDLIGAIAARVSLKRSEAKMVFDVVLDEIGKALDASDEVVVPPLGKLMVKKRDIKPGGPMLTLKLKRADAAPEAGDLPPLADPGEDG